MFDSKLCRRLVSCLKKESWTVGEAAVDDDVVVAVLFRIVPFDTLGVADLDDGGLREVEAAVLLLGVR